MKTQIFENYAEFLKREDKELNGVSEEFAKANPNFSEENETNKGCSRCYDLKNSKPTESEINKVVIPIIENIHQKIYAAASQPLGLDMSTWHSNTCNTTHCRAGWIVHLAGEAGYALENFHGGNTLVAALSIIHASSPIEVDCPQFFEGNEAAMEDMKKCAESEAKLC